jgi:tetratricopeptide (TPR) repeat protein
MRLTCLIPILSIAFAQQAAVWQQHMSEALRLEKEGRYKEAKALYLLALKEEETSVEGGFRGAVTWNNLALVNRYLGLHSEAREGYQRVLAMFERLRGQQSPEYASVLHNLAVLDYLDGRLDDAAAQFDRALKIRKDVLGERHPSAAQTMNSLSAVYANQRRYAEAERLCRDALAIQEKELGAEHPQVSETLDNLASIYRLQGQLDFALEASLRAEQIGRKVYGDNHPITCRRSRKIAFIHGYMGRYSEAETMLRRVLQVQLHLLDEDNPDVAPTIGNLAAVSYHLKRFEESDTLYHRAESILERSRTNDRMLFALLSNHGKVLRQTGDEAAATKLKARISALVSASQNKMLRFTTNVEDLLSTDASGAMWPESAWKTLSDKGNRLREQGRCRDALRLLLKARSGAVDELGPTHTSNAIPTNNLATAYFCLGELGRAERYFREALALLSADHFSTMRAGILNNLGTVLLRLDRVKDAEPLLSEALTITEAANGADHPATATAVTTVGVLRLRAGEYAQARDLFQRALAIRQTSAGDNADTATALDNLGVANLYLGENEKARDLTARALEIRRRLLPTHHPDLALSLYNYAVALERVGQRKQARAAFREAEGSRSAFASENRTGLTVHVGQLGRR